MSFTEQNLNTDVTGQWSEQPHWVQEFVSIEPSVWEICLADRVFQVPPGWLICVTLELDTDRQAAEEEAECDGGSTRQASRTTPSESTRIATLSWWCHNNIQRLTTFFLKQMQMKANEVSGLSVLSDCVKKLLKKYSCVGAWKPAYICKRPCCPYKKSHFQANSTGLFVWLLSLLLSCVSYVHCTNCSKLPWKA